MRQWLPNYWTRPRELAQVERAKIARSRARSPVGWYPRRALRAFALRPGRHQHPSEQSPHIAVIRTERVHTIGLRHRQPTVRIYPYDTRYKRWEYPVSRTGQAVGHGYYGPDGHRSPCTYAAACGS